MTTTATIKRQSVNYNWRGYQLDVEFEHCYNHGMKCGETIEVTSVTYFGFDVYKLMSGAECDQIEQACWDEVEAQKERRLQEEIEARR